MSITTTTAEKGFSLLELVVALGVMSIIMGVAFNLMTSSQSSFDRSKLMAESRENADFAVSRITELIRGAGANPEGSSTINALNFISNKETETSTPDPTVVRILSDFDGDGRVDGRVDAASPADSKYYVVSSEDMTVKYFRDAVTTGGVDIPANSVCLIDNTPGDGQGVPRVLATRIVDFSCPVGANPREVTMTLTAGSSHDVAPTDPRFVSFTRVSQIRLRNRN